MADPVSQELRVLVGRIFDPLESGLAQLGNQVDAPALDQRADDPVANRRDPGEAPKTGALENAHEGCFRLVVRSVAKGDARRPDAVGARGERRVARGARCGLERAAPLDGHRRYVHGDAEPLTEPPHELGVPRGVGAQPVVDVECVEAETPRGGERGEHVEEGDGVGAARHGDQNTFAAREHRVAANRALHPLEQGHDATRPGVPPRPRRPRSAPSSRRAPCA